MSTDLSNNPVVWPAHNTPKSHYDAYRRRPRKEPGLAGARLLADTPPPPNYQTTFNTGKLGRHLKHKLLELHSAGFKYVSSFFVLITRHLNPFMLKECRTEGVNEMTVNKRNKTAWPSPIFYIVTSHTKSFAHGNSFRGQNGGEWSSPVASTHFTR